MRPLRLAMAAIATAALLAACGSSAGQIPVDSANTLHGDLTAVDTAFLNGDCSAASAALSTAQIDFYNLLATVNQKLAGQLERGLSTLSHDEQRQCRHSGSGGGSTAGTGTGQTGQTGSTGTTSSSSTSSSTTSSTSTSSTSTSTTSSATTGVTGPTCTSTTGGNGGTPACDGSTSPSGIGGAGSGGGIGTGAASLGN